MGLPGTGGRPVTWRGYTPNPYVWQNPAQGVNYDQFAKGQVGDAGIPTDQSATYTGKQSIGERAFDIAPDPRWQQSWKGNIGNTRDFGNTSNPNPAPVIPGQTQTGPGSTWDQTVASANS